jgi:MerR family copper efflux transcriptional regulator
MTRAISSGLPSCGCRDFALPIERIRELISLMDSPEQDCSKARDVAELHLNEVRKKLAELRALEDGLAHFAVTCTERCAGGPARDCVILEDLSTGATCCR